MHIEKKLSNGEPYSQTKHRHNVTRSEGITSRILLKQRYGLLKEGQLFKKKNCS